jgi:hypothetical protein
MAEHVHIRIGATPRPGCPPGDAGLLARRLYRATLDHLRRSANPGAERHLLLGPLSAALAIQKTRDGVACCAALNAALARGDYEAALDACVALVDIAVAASRSDEPPVPEG